MQVQIGDREFDLKTNLGTVKLIEGRFKMPLTNVFTHLSEATVDEMIIILSLGLGGKAAADSAGFIEAIETAMDYMTIWAVLKEYILNLMFSGTSEQKEDNIAKSDFDEPQKNEFRRLLGLPEKAFAAPATSTPAN